MVLAVAYIVSCGFDAAMGDPIGESFVTPAGFATMTHLLKSVSRGKLVLALEVFLFINDREVTIFLL